MPSHGGSGGQDGSHAQGRARKPMYEDEHASCSVLLAKIRNEDQLLALPPHDQFRWLHRFYLVLDRIAEQHRVYKLYGGPHGFMISTGVAEPDDSHAATLLRFSLHLLQAVRSIRLPGMKPLDLVMVLSSGPASSGLLGTTSLTYQIVGKSVSVARELMETQRSLPFILTAGMARALLPSVSCELCHVGSARLNCAPGEDVQLYTLARYSQMPISTLDAVDTAVAAEGTPPAVPAAAAADGGQPGGSLGGERGAAGAGGGGDPVSAAAVAAAAFGGLAAEAPPLAAEGAAPAAAAAPSSSRRLLQRLAAERRQRQAERIASSLSFSSEDDGARKGKAGAAGEQGKRGSGGYSKASSSVPRNTASSDAGPPADLLLRFENPVLESAFTRFNTQTQSTCELAWLLLGLITAVLYSAASVGRGYGLPLPRVLLFQALPMAGAALWRWRRPTFLRYREALWFSQRLVVLLGTSLPGSFVFVHPLVTRVFGFGLCNLVLEVLTRRLRLHLQLLSSLCVYVAALTLMGLHPEGSSGRALVTPSYLSLHLVLTALLPAAVTFLADSSTRLVFLGQLREQDGGEAALAAADPGLAPAAAQSAAAARQQAACARQHFGPSPTVARAAC